MVTYVLDCDPNFINLPPFSYVAVQGVEMIYTDTKCYKSLVSDLNCFTIMCTSKDFSSAKFKLNTFVKLLQ